jgi:hypothetical protein
MDLTTLGLKKPLVTEAYDLQIVNDNADKVNELITADRALINSFAPHLSKKISKVAVAARDLSITGLQTITGVGFKPKSAIVISTVPGVTAKASWGIVDEVNSNRCIFDYNTTVAGSYVDVDSAAFIQDSSSNFTKGTVTFIDDGFTIDWVKGGTGATGTAIIEVLLITH